MGDGYRVEPGSWRIRLRCGVGRRVFGAGMDMQGREACGKRARRTLGKGGMGWGLNLSFTKGLE